MAELAAAYVSLLPSLRGAGKEINKGLNSPEVQRAADKAGENTGSRMGAGLKAPLLAGAVAAAAVAGAALAKGVGDALEREKLGDKAAAALGLSEKQSAKAGAVAGRLYAGAYGESMADVTSAVESVLSSVEGMSSATPKQLEGVTASVLDLATAFDLDVSEAARNVGILIKNGLAKDATEATDLITRSLQEVPKALRGEVTDATQEYSQFFADLGYTGAQAIGLLVSATEDGQYGVDKMGDAVKEFTIRSTDMSKATKAAYAVLGIDARNTTNELLAGGERAKQAFETIIAGIQGVKDPAKQAEVALALFGTPLEDLGTSEIPKFLAGLTSTSSSLGQVDGAAAKLGTTLNDNLATRLESIRRTAEVLVSGVLMSMFTWFDKNARVIGLLATVVGTAAAAWGIYTLATQGVPALIAAVRAAQIALNAALIANPIGLVVTAVGALVGALVWFFTQTEIGQKIVSVAWKGIQIAIGAVVDWVRQYMVPFFKALWVTWAAGWTLLWKGVQVAWRTIGQPVFDAVRTGATAVWNWLDRYVFKPTALGFQLMAMAFQAVHRQIIRPLWESIKTVFSSAWNWISDRVIDPFKRGVRLMAEAFRPAVDIIRKAWSGIRAAAAEPINFVIETVYTKGIKATWDKIAKSVGLDLVLPTVKPIAYANGGVENHTAQIARAGAMRLWAEPETGGEAYIPLAPSKRGRSTAILADVANRFGYGLTTFADGGIFGWVGDAWDAAANVGKILANPTRALGDLLAKPLESVLGRIGGGSIGKIAAQLPRQAVGALVEKAKGLVSSILPSGGKAGPAMGWQAQWDVVKSMFPNAVLHSALRPGAVTAVGTPSYHGAGRAIDITPSMAIFDWLARTFPNSTELIYSPAGGRQLYMGQKTLFGEPTRGDHWDHIHWAMKNGGVLPKLYDQGGWLPSGGFGINQTGKPEAVLDPDESRALKAGLARRPAPNLVFNTTRVSTRDVIFALDLADLHDVGGPA